ncbi:hypothetical protein VNI00_017582 [Paramarasmius palmivorus]|uniref:Uncharacterized protein n=1 Tax=Paramarasmius palmivorus TaxID=297713 RepID=A0AAW0B5M3_9AGAR
MERAVSDAEEALGEVLNLLSETTLTDGPDPERRESYATAMSQPSSVETTYTDESYEELIRSIPLSPKGGHAHIPTPEIIETVNPRHLVDKGTQTDDIPKAHPSHRSILTKEPFFQTFSRSSVFRPYSYNESRFNHTPETSSVPSISDIRLIPTKLPKKATTPSFATRSPKDARIDAPSTARPVSRSKGKEKEVGSAYLVLNGKNNVHHVYSDYSKAKAAKAHGSSLIPFATYQEAQLALEGCIQSNLASYLGDTRYKKTWFAVLKGSHTTVCQRGALLKSIGNEYLGKLVRDDIVPAASEEEAESIYVDHMHLYADD